MNNVNFYDTSALLVASELGILSDIKNLLISSVTLQELENLKTSARKTEETRRNAQKVISFLNNLMPEDRSNIIVTHRSEYEQCIIDKGFEITNDTKILSDAVHIDAVYKPDETVFVTNDLSLYNFAEFYFGTDMIQKVTEYPDEYCGVKEVVLSEEELAKFYDISNAGTNKFNLLKNEYLIIKDEIGKVVARYKWNGFEYEEIRFHDFTNSYLGDIKPIDVYQELACDSLISNPITMIRGRAGSGKSLMSMGYLFYLLDKRKIDKIILFGNPIATINSAKLGYYPGTRDQKMMDSQIGNFLSSKLGDKYGVEQLMVANKLVLLPFSDIRGYDTSNMRAGIYITEAQNLDTTLMKLALQRVGKDCVCVIEGDDKEQVDDICFAGKNNGMKKLSKVFRGTEVYGEVEFKNIHRSKIAEIANNI